MVTANWLSRLTTISFPKINKSYRVWLRRVRLLLLSCLALIMLNGSMSQLVQAQTEADSDKKPAKIVNYQSDIFIQKDASLKVTETIDVKTTGDEIEEGFYREFPLNAPFMMGPMQFQVVEVSKNKNPIEYEVKNKGNKKRLQIESKGMELAADTYSYTIEYQIDRQLDFSDSEVDRLYWNVTGNDWHFPIEQVQAKVWLPDGIGEDNVSVNAFTGTQQDKSNRYEVEINAEGNPIFTTTTPLQPQETLTIIVRFPSGYLERPSVTETLSYVVGKALWDLLQTFSVLAALLVIIIALIIIMIGIFSNSDFPLISKMKDNSDR